MEDDFVEIIDKIQESHKEMIGAFRKIMTNIDIVMEYKQYCGDRKEIKTGGIKNEIGRTQEAVNIFFRNTKAFLKEYFAIEIDKLNIFKFEYDNMEIEVNISDLYALLVNAALGGNAEFAVKDEFFSGDKEELVKAFAAKLRERTEDSTILLNVSAYLIKKTAQNAKNNMDCLASNIQRYYSMNREDKLEEREINVLCSVYGKIIDTYLVSHAEIISEELHSEYKLMVKRYKKTCQ